ncbi:hypothetical protein [uncultured Brachyspira sp.]|uniref:hypothetical protein n=1 Tax=uncultured Brachyspira sp. TaxID=221953 RepID=UPI00321FD4C6
MFELETKYYEEHKQELREKYLGKHIVIQGNELKGIYNTDNEAFDNSVKTMKPGTFMIKIVTATDEEGIPRFTSRVYGK